MARTGAGSEPAKVRHSLGTTLATLARLAVPLVVGAGILYVFIRFIHWAWRPPTP